MRKVIAPLLLSIAAMLALGSGQYASAGTQADVYIGGPGWSYAPGPAYSSPYYYSQPNYAPYGTYTPEYGGYYYAEPRWRDRDWRRDREHREHERREHERREHERRERRERHDRW
jgi:hypothetical protein